VNCKVEHEKQDVALLFSYCIQDIIPIAFSSGKRVRLIDVVGNCFLIVLRSVKARSASLHFRITFVSFRLTGLSLAAIPAICDSGHVVHIAGMIGGRARR
jgi:hypothetical protein